ncbi:MAG: TolC family protein [Arcobacteraceae bacterium]|nr:TolC family protein [Arcobacteraceae bacterium]
MKITIFLMFVCLSLSANKEIVKNKHILFSQNSNNSCNTSFNEILSYGLGFHPSISMSKDIIKGANFQLDSAAWGYYPTPTVDVSTKSSHNTQTVVRLDQPLWTGGRIDAAYDKAKAQKKEALYSYEENQYKLIENYLDTLQNYLQAQQKIKVLNENKKQFNSLMEMLDRMIKAGVASQTDKDLLKSRLSYIYSDLVVTKAQLRVSKIQFEILTGKQIDCNINFNYKQIFRSAIIIEKLIEDILAFHPTLKIIDSKIQSAISDVANSKSKLWPSLMLRGEHRSGTIYDETRPESENLVYLTFQVSTGAGISALSNISKSKINVSKVKYEKLSKQKDLIDNLMNDYTNYITAKSHKEIVETNIITANKIYESNQRLFLSQNKKWLDVVNSLSELNKQKISDSKLLVESRMLEYKISLKTGRISLKTGNVASDI